jgi:hypothetical protein
VAAGLPVVDVLCGDEAGAELAIEHERRHDNVGVEHDLACEVDDAPARDIFDLRTPRTGATPWATGAQDPSGKQRDLKTVCRSSSSLGGIDTVDDTTLSPGFLVYRSLEVAAVQRAFECGFVSGMPSSPGQKATGVASACVRRR